MKIYLLIFHDAFEDTYKSRSGAAVFDSFMGIIISISQDCTDRMRDIHVSHDPFFYRDRAYIAFSQEEGLLSSAKNCGSGIITRFTGLHRILYPGLGIDADDGFEVGIPDRDAGDNGPFFCNSGFKAETRREASDSGSSCLCGDIFHDQTGPGGDQFRRPADAHLCSSLRIADRGNSESGAG